MNSDIVTQLNADIADGVWLGFVLGVILVALSVAGVYGMRTRRKWLRWVTVGFFAIAGVAVLVWTYALWRVFA